MRQKVLLKPNDNSQQSPINKLQKFSHGPESQLMLTEIAMTIYTRRQPGLVSL